MILNLVLSHGFKLMEYITLIVEPSLREELYMYNHKFTETYVNKLTIIYFLSTVILIVKFKLFTCLYAALGENKKTVINNFKKRYIIIIACEEAVNFFFYMIENTDQGVFWFEFVISVLICIWFWSVLTTFVYDLMKLEETNL